MKPRFGSLALFATVALALVCSYGAPEPEVLRTAREIRRLSAEEAGERRPVELSGVVLGQVEPFGESLVLRDDTDSIYLLGDESLISPFSPGDTIEVKGHTVTGSFAPFVRVDAARKTGTSPLPEPTRVASDDLFAKGLDAQWVVVAGVIRDLKVAPLDPQPANPAQGLSNRFIMTLAVGDRLVTVQSFDRIEAEKVVDAEVEVRGICFNLHNAERQFLSPLILVPQGIDFVIRKPPPSGPFELPAVSSRSLFQFRPDGFSMHRVRVDGVALHQVSGVGIWIRDDGGGFFVQSEERTPLKPGDLVRAAGFPAQGEFSPILSHAVYEKTGSGPSPSPARLRMSGEEVDHNNDLVEIEGVLTGRQDTTQGVMLHVRSRGATVEVIGNGRNAAWSEVELELGSTVSVVGICRLLALEGEHRLSGLLMPENYKVLARGPSDIVVVERAPWWNSKRIAVLLACVIATLIAILAAVFIVSRRRLNKERARRALEISAFKARLAERSQLARDLHDSLAQGLGAISLQLDLAGSPDGATSSPNQARQHVSMAHQLVRASIVEVRSFIRNLRTQTQQDMGLDVVLRDLLSTAVEGSDIRTDFRIEGVVWEPEPLVKEQIIRVVQEAIANAVRHSDGTEVTVSARYSPASLVVTVADNGKGFALSADLEENLHFGLLGMRERAALIGAEMKIASVAKMGTRIILSVSRNAAPANGLNL